MGDRKIPSWWGRCGKPHPTRIGLRCRLLPGHKGNHRSAAVGSARKEIQWAN